MLWRGNSFAALVVWVRTVCGKTAPYGSTPISCPYSKQICNPTSPFSFPPIMKLNMNALSVPFPSPRCPTYLISNLQSPTPSLLSHSGSSTDNLNQTSTAQNGQLNWHFLGDSLFFLITGPPLPASQSEACACPSDVRYLAL